MTTWTERAGNLRRGWRQLDLKLLIWGPKDPGPSGTADEALGYRKRVQIRETLRSAFRHAAVHFSEDSEMSDVTTGLLDDDLTREAVQAKTSDGIVVLEISRGTAAELDTCVKYPWFRAKAFVLLPQRHIESKSITANSVLGKVPRENIVGYTDEQFKTCVVATELALRVADTIAVRRVLDES